MKKFLFIITTALTAFAAPASAITVTEGPTNNGPAGLVCDGTQVMCAPFLTGDYFYGVLPVAGPVVVTNPGGEAVFTINLVLSSLSWNYWMNDSENNAIVTLGSGIDVFVSGNNFSSGATRINVSFDQGQLVDKIIFSNGDGYNAWNGLAMEVADPVAGVPEPSSWAMMIVGFGFVGLGMRRRQSRCLVDA